MSDIPEHMLFGYPTKREYDAGELDNAYSNEFQVYTSFVLGKVVIVRKKNYLDGFMPIVPKSHSKGSGLGYVEATPKESRAYGRYKYRVIARNGLPNHHTNSLPDATSWLDHCRKHWDDRRSVV